MKSLLIVFLGAIVVLFAGLGKKEAKLMALALFFLIAALVMIPLDMLGKLPWEFELKHVPIEMLMFDKTALLFSGVMILASIFVIGLFSNKKQMGTDLLGLIMFSLSGGILLTSFNNLIMLFLGLEALSIPLYVLAGSNKNSLKGNEAAIKYFLMGAFSTAIFLLGAAFVYGATGALDLESIYRAGASMVHMKALSPLMTVGISLLLIGLSFKASAVPFHFWSPDVYEGSPNRATVFMATVVKIAAFAAFFRLFSIALIDLRIEFWGNIIAAISAITILVGNIGALKQTSIKRTLAYSSVAHAGYMLMAILSSPEAGFWALIVYGLGYISASALVFYYFNQVSKNGDETFEAFNGLAKQNKMAALFTTIALISMAGIPLTAGFAGKYAIFSSAFTNYPILVMIALVGSAISVAYYFRFFKSMYFSAGESNIQSSIVENVFTVIAVCIIIAIGIYPALITDLGLFKF